MKKLLLSAPLACPGAFSALRNHAAVLKGTVDCELRPLEHIIFPFLKSVDTRRYLPYRIAKRMKVFSVKKILPYGENIIFAGYGPIFSNIVHTLNRHNIRPSFIWCSTLGQLEMTHGESRTFMSILDLLNNGRIKYLFLHKRLYDSMSGFIQKATYLPHSIDLVPYENITRSSIKGVNIDLFCRPRHGKNILNQMQGFSMAQTGGRLHINFDTRSYSGIVETLLPDITKHEWLPLKEYYKLVAAMDMSLQVTIGESFNYAVCERMALGIPALTTEDIYLVSENKKLRQYLCVHAPDTPPAIASAIIRIVKDKKLRKDLSSLCKERIGKVAKINNSTVKEVITDCYK